METEMLDNGLTVHVCANQWQALVAVNLRYRVGSADEEPGRSGFAHLAEHLMFSGTANVERSGHLRAIQSLGGYVNATTAPDWTSYHSVAPADTLELILWLEAERLHYLASHVDSADLESERDVVINERRQTVDNVPYGTVAEDLLASFFSAGHPYDHAPIGSIKDLESASVDVVQDFLSRHYAPDRLVLSICGNVSPPAAIKAVREHFGSLGPAPARRTPPGESTAALVRRGQRSLSAEQDGAPPRLFIGCLLPPSRAADFEAARIAASALARGEGSVLIRSLVAEREVATDVKVRITPLARDASLGIVEIVPRGSELAGVAAAYFEQVAAAAADGVPDAQFARTMAQHEAHWCERFDSIAGQADELSWHTVMGSGSPHGYEHPLRCLDRFSPDELMRGLRAWTGQAGLRILSYPQPGPPPGAFPQAGQQ